MMTSRKLWDASPLTCFKAFVKTADFVEITKQAVLKKRPPISDKSALVYISMFRTFDRWMSKHHKIFSALGQDDLLQFLGADEDADKTSSQRLNSKISYRYLRLLERCFDYLQVVPNPAKHAIFQTFQEGKLAKDAPTVALQEHQIAAFLDALPSAPVSRRPGSANWKRRRDRAMQITMLLGGLRVTEAVGLLLTEVSEQTRFDDGLELDLTPAEKHDISYAHTTILPATAAAELLTWLAERACLRIPGPYAFPADLQGAMLNKSTVYRQVKATFQRAGIDDVPRTGGRTLRNTFAVHELRNGMTVPELTESLGLALERSTQPYLDITKQVK